MTVLPVEVGANHARSYNGALMSRGKEAENIVIEFIKNRPDVLGISDWRELRQVQEADVDIAIKTRDGRTILAEIKSDSYLGISQNVLFEVLRINHTCQPDFSLTLGWSGRTPAKYILYYAPNVNAIYQFETSSIPSGLTRVASTITSCRRRIVSASELLTS